MSEPAECPVCGPIPGYCPHVEAHDAVRACGGCDHEPCLCRFEDELLLEEARARGEPSPAEIGTVSADAQAERDATILRLRGTKAAGPIYGRFVRVLRNEPASKNPPRPARNVWHNGHVLESAAVAGKTVRTGGQLLVVKLEPRMTAAAQEVVVVDRRYDEWRLLYP